MKYLLMLITTLLFGSVQALSLPEALSQAAQRPAVINSRLELSDARSALERTQADPLALRFENLQAEQRLVLAEASLDQARYQAFNEIAEAYTQVLSAKAQLELADMAKSLSEQALEIARIRFEKGSATDLDVEDAQNNLADAEKNLAAASEGLQLARSNLAGLIGQEFEEIEPLDAKLLIELPPLADILPGLAQYPELLKAQQGLELASLGLELLDPSYAPQAQIDSAKLQVSQTQEFSREARRGLQLQTKSLYNQAQTAAKTWLIRQDALRNANARLEIERQRLASGLIAEISYRQAELNNKQAELEALEAQHAYLLALLKLQAGSMTALEGLDGF